MACVSAPPTLEQGQRLMQAGQLNQACDLFMDLVERGGSRAARLSSMQKWVECLSRSGQLQQAKTWLSSQPHDGAQLYGSALVEVAHSPAGLPRALELLEQAEARWPEEGEIPYRRGVLLLSDDQPGGALPILERACKKNDTARCAAARAHALYDVGRVEEALRQIQRIPQLHPGPKEVSRGKQLIQKVLQRVSKLPPRLRPAYSKALDQINQLDDPGAAIKILEDLLVDDPGFGVIYTLLGMAHLRLEHNAEATVAFRRARQLNPLDAENSLYLAAIYQSRQGWDAAVSEYRTALQLNPFLWRAAHQLGQLLLQLQRPKEAAEAFEQAVLVDGGSPLSLRLAGRAHLAAGALAPAEAYFQRIYRSQPQDFEVNLRLAQLLVRRADGPDALTLRSRAIIHVQRAVKIRPHDSELESLRTQLKID